MITAARPSPARHVPCEKCPLRAQPSLRDFSQDELDFIAGFKSGELTAEAGTTLLMQGTASAHLYTVLSGWAVRHKTLPDGRRQILNFVLPADFIGLQGTVLGEMQHSVEALSDMVLCVFPRERLWELYRGHPSLAFDLTWIASREEQMLAEHLVSVGRRHALERIAFVLLHLFLRAEQVRMTSDNKVEFPFTQQHLADALGMSLVHTNKTLRRLIASKAARWKNRTFEVLDREALTAMAGYQMKDQQPRPFI
jgi:CRP/FNR family transcriptional regulator, anaerobic regulatory protein